LGSSEGARDTPNVGLQRREELRGLIEDWGGGALEAHKKPKEGPQVEKESLGCSILLLPERGKTRGRRKKRRYFSLFKQGSGNQAGGTLPVGQKTSRKISPFKAPKVSACSLSGQ